MTKFIFIIALILTSLFVNSQTIELSKFRSSIIYFLNSKFSEKYQYDSTFCALLIFTKNLKNQRIEHTQIIHILNKKIKIEKETIFNKFSFNLLYQFDTKIQKENTQNIAIAYLHKDVGVNSGQVLNSNDLTTMVDLINWYNQHQHKPKTYFIPYIIYREEPMY